MSRKDENRAKEDGISLMSEGKFREAGVKAKVEADQHPGDYEFRPLLAVALMNQEKYERARKALLTAVEEFPDERGFWNVPGGAYGLKSDWHRAEASYRKLLALAGDAVPDEIADLHCSIAGSLWEQHNRDVLDIPIRARDEPSTIRVLKESMLAYMVGEEQGRRGKK